MAAETPVVRWDAKRAQLVGPEGIEVTRAQDVKARRYVEKALVKQMSRFSQEVAWSQPWKETFTYRVDPLPGCRVPNEVRVIAHHNESDEVVAVDYACDCQRAQGTTALRPTVCSHTLAVHRYRAEEAKRR